MPILSHLLARIISFCVYASYFQVPYVETSAKDPPVNVDLAFHDVVRVIK